jgi:hypothetical protein
LAGDGSGNEGGAAFFQQIDAALGFFGRMLMTKSPTSACLR